MRRPISRLFASATLATLLSGCALFGKGLDPGPASAERIGTVGSAQTRDYPIDMAELIAYAVHGSTNSAPRALAAAEAASAAGRDSPLNSLELARKYFYENCHSNDRCGMLRDRVQDRLVWASESACADYLSNVRRSFTGTNLNLGGATTLFGALGSVLTSVDATRIFSGAAAVASGLRAEYNDVYFSSQAFELVSKAIRSVREKTIKNIRDNRANKGIREYTLDGAVADALRYHASCNVMAGLEEASEAVTRDRDPGLKRLSELLQDAGAGVNVALGTAAIDTSSLPSAAQSCQRLKTLAAEGTATQAAFELLAAKPPATGADGAAASEAKTDLDKRRVDAARHAGALKKIDDDNATDCAPDKGSVAKAEVAMFEAMRNFASLPLTEKAAGKARFDAERAKVLALKVRIDGALADARTAFESLVAATRAP